MLKETCISTIEYLGSKTKTERKRIGQFFTSEPAAEFMGCLFDVRNESIRVADPGAGTGILTSAMLDHFFNSNRVKRVVLDVFENDENVLPTLEHSITLWKSVAAEKGIDLEVTLIKDNFVTCNQLNWHNGFYQGEYDFIISNPPYKKISKTDIEARIMDGVVYGQPNLYFLFMAMACNLLKDNGEMVFIVPRSWTSGLYFKAFREYLLTSMRIERIHQFVSRRRVFENEDVLQETIIVKATKTEVGQESIIISSSDSIDDFTEPNILNIPYNLCVEEQGDRFVYLPISEEEVAILSVMEDFEDTLSSLGFRMKTGPTVDFRSMEAIHDEPDEKSLPLLWAYNISSGRIQFPVSGVTGQYISSMRKSLLIEKDNYLIVKRFSSKEERRRLQPAILLSGYLQEYEMFSAENHLNYITNSHGGLEPDEVYGLFVIFNSTLWDRYYRILNGSTQVNASECNSFPMPDLRTVKRFGERIQGEEYLTTELCDSIVMEELSGHRRRENNFVGVGHAEKTAS